MNRPHNLSKWFISYSGKNICVVTTLNARKYCYNVNISFSCFGSGFIWEAASNSNISRSNLSTTASTFTAGSFAASTVILAASGAPAIWGDSTAFSAASFAGLTTGLWRASRQRAASPAPGLSCSSADSQQVYEELLDKEQHLLHQDLLVLLQTLQQVYEELSLKSSVSCIKIISFLCWLYNRSAKSCHKEQHVLHQDHVLLLES